MSAAPENERGTRNRGVWHSGLVLAAGLIGALAILQAIAWLTDERIAAARAERLAATLAEVLPDTAIDNDPADDVLHVAVPVTGDDRGRATVPVYRARSGGIAVGAVLTVVAPNGYSGPIELLVGVDAAGRVVAVRVTGHRETPGLGDRIERRRSTWITQFDGRALDPAEPGGWRIEHGSPDGSERDVGPVDTEHSDTGTIDAGAFDAGLAGAEPFDALTGATITSDAVVEAVQRALLWFDAHRDTVFADG